MCRLLKARSHVYFPLCLSAGRTGLPLFCSATLLSWVHHLDFLLILICSRYPGASRKLIFTWGSTGECDLCWPFCLLWLREASGRAWGWDAVSTHICTDFLSPAELVTGSLRRQELIPGTAWNFAFIYRYSPLTHKKHIQTSSHKAFPFPLRSLACIYRELNSTIQGICDFGRLSA